MDTSILQGMVERGAELQRAIADAEEELRGIKSLLREAVASGGFKPTSTGAFEIRSSSSATALITQLKDTPVPADGVDLARVAGAVQPATFKAMFRKAVLMQPVARFEEAFRLAPEAEQRVVRGFVTWRPNTAQVRFSR